MTTELQAAAAEIEQKKQTRMSEEELEKEVASLQTYKLFPDDKEKLVTLSDVLALIKKYRG